MEENKNLQSGEPEATQNSAEQNEVVTTEPVAVTEQTVEPTEAVASPADDTTVTPVAETATPAEATATAETTAPKAKVKVKKAKGGKTSFGKIFLAALLAVMAGSVLSMLFWGILFSGFSSMMQPSQTDIPKSAILRIDLSESLVEAPSKDPMAMFDFASMTTNGELTLYNALRAIEKASTDERIKGIYINLNGAGSVSITSLEELRAAIETFKQSGKFVVSYNEVYSQIAYYFCSVADKIYIQPEGSFEWKGLSVDNMFFKGLIDKLGVEVSILRPTVCKYKSAVEPFFLTKMSDANRAQNQQLANTMWGIITEAVSKSRGISVEALNQLADELAVTLPSEAVEHKFADATLYADQVEELFKSEYGIEEPEFVSLGEYASSLVPNAAKAAAPKVAIVYAQGDIVDGSGSDDKIYGYTLAKTINKVAEDDDVKAVVLRVNSPGGSALASDIIWREIKLLQQKKPIIVSMGHTAASGGYYISAPADAIVADKFTLTGSIGVFGMLPSFGAALEKNLGVTIDGVTTNKHSNMGNGFSPLAAQEHQALMRGVDRVYERFTSLVADGRNLTIERVLEIAEGRVWTGVEAQQIGLVDTCGGLTAALAIAVDKSGLGDNFQIVEIEDEATGLMAMLQSLNVRVREGFAPRGEFGKFYNQYKYVEQMLSNKGIYTYCPSVYRIE